MSYAQRHTVSLTTDASGDATGYTPVITGRIQTIIYAKADFADGVDFTVTAEATGQAIWAEANVNASAIRAPRQATHDTIGVASLYAVGGEPVEDHICVANDRIKIVIAQGGATKTGAVTVILG